MQERGQCGICGAPLPLHNLRAAVGLCATWKEGREAMGSGGNHLAACGVGAAARPDSLPVVTRACPEPPPPPTFRGMPRVALSLWPHPGISPLTGVPQSSHTLASAHLSLRQAPSRWAGGQVGRGRSHGSQLGPGFWLLAPVPFLFARPGWPRRSPQASPTPTARCLSGWIERTLPALRRRSTAPRSHTCQLGLAAPRHENLLAGKWGPEVWPRNRSE